MSIPKRYQVFISSTFRDLEQERSQVMKAVLSLRCFPAGMELFVATNKDLWDYIKQIIDDSDYYVLIVAGMSGSTHPKEKLSYTEVEYDYAVSKGKNILRFVQKDIENLPAAKRDYDTEKIELRRSFVKKVLGSSKGAYLWNDVTDLSTAVTAALHAEIQENKAIGWVRGDANLTPVIENISSTLHHL